MLNGVLVSTDNRTAGKSLPLSEGDSIEFGSATRVRVSMCIPSFRLNPETLTGPAAEAAAAAVRSGTNQNDPGVCVCARARVCVC